MMVIALYGAGAAYPQIKLTDEEKYLRFEDTWAAFLDYYGSRWISTEARFRGYTRERTADYAGEVMRGMREAQYDADEAFLSRIGVTDDSGFINDNRALLESLAEEVAPVQRLTILLGEKGLLKEEYDNLSRLVFVKTYLVSACKYLDLTSYGNGTTDTVLHNVVNEISGWAGGAGKWKK
jgi:hypothetical protein